MFHLLVVDLLVLLLLKWREKLRSAERIELKFSRLKIALSTVNARSTVNPSTSLVL